MRKSIKVLGVDVGKASTGWAFLDEVGEETGHFKFKSLAHFEKTVKSLVERFKPSVIVTAYPTKFYSVIVFQSKLGAILELICEKKGIQYTEISDVKARNDVLGKSTVSKEKKKKLAKLQAVADDCPEGESEEYAETIGKINTLKKELRQERKQEVMDYFHKTDPDEADSLLFAQWLYNANT